MRLSLAGVLILLGCAVTGLRAQSAVSSPAPAKTAPAAAQKEPVKNSLAASVLAPTNEPVTTEIYANEADFNSKDYVGTFSGPVIVKDPRFSLQADKLTVYLSRGKEQGLEKAVAEGNVAVVRDAPGEAGGAPVRSIGRAERAVYTAKDGNVEMTGTPRVQSGLNSHVATSPDTVMIINQSGQLTTRGPSRTELRQEPKPAATPTP